MSESLIASDVEDSTPLSSKSELVLILLNLHYIISYGDVIKEDKEG